MTELLSLLNDLSMPLKVAWAVWLLWAAAQILWYRRSRRARARPQPAPLRKAVARPRPEAKPPSEATAAAHELATLAANPAFDFASALEMEERQRRATASAYR